MSISPELAAPIRDFLIATRLFESEEQRIAIISAAGFDDELRAQIAFGGQTLNFISSCLETLSGYGNLKDGRDALQACLEAIKKRVGQDKQSVIDVFIAHWLKEHEASGGAATSLKGINMKPIEKGFMALAVQMQRNKNLQTAAANFDTYFEDTRKQLENLRAYKDLHDALHDLQIKCYDQIMMDMGSSPAFQTGWDNLDEHLFQLQLLLERLKEITARGCIRVEETDWIRKWLVPAEEDLRHAMEGRDTAKLQAGTRKLNRVLVNEPSLINKSLYDLATSLRLSELSVALTKLRDEIATGKADSQDLQHFLDCIEALARLRRHLESLVKEHYGWQQVDNELRRITALLPNDSEELRLSWPEVKKMTEPLLSSQSSPWKTYFQSNTEKLDGAIARGEQARISEPFRRFTTLVRERFYQVDVTLKGVCDKLPDIAGPLDAVLRSMH